MSEAMDEARLTAYALGELDPQAAAEVEAHLADHPDDQDLVAEIAATASAVRGALAAAADRVPELRPPVHQATHRKRIGVAWRGPGQWYSSRLVWTLAASVLIVAGTYALVLPQIYRVRDRAAENPPTTRPAGGGNPILVLPPPEFVRRPGTGGDALPGNTGTGVEIGQFIAAAETPTAVFPLSADTEAYRTMKRFFDRDELPPADMVSVAAVVNAVRYADRGEPAGPALRGQVEIAGCPWNDNHRLAKIDVRGAGQEADDVVARQVKVQVSFDPRQVRSYRLLGYEGKGGGKAAESDVRAGQAVTALYEMVPAARPPQDPTPPLTVLFSYATPAAEKVTHRLPAADPGRPFAQASPEFRLAAGAAAFALKLQQPKEPALDYPTILRWVEDAVQAAPAPDRQELLDLIKTADRLAP